MYLIKFPQQLFQFPFSDLRIHPLSALLFYQSKYNNIVQSKIQNKQMRLKNLSLQPILLFFIILTLHIASTREVYPEGLWAMNSFGPFTSQNEQILAYYDFNRDRNVDVLTRISSNGYLLQIYLWNDQQRIFEKSGNVSMEIFKPIVAIPADIIFETELDLLVGLEVPFINQQQKLSTKLEIVTFTVSCERPQQKQGRQNCTFQKSNLEPFQSKTFPTVMQLEGKNVIVYSQQKQLRTKVFYNGTLQQFSFYDEYFVEPSPEGKQNICVDYLDIFYLDYNGDCYQDLIIFCNPRAGMANIQFYKGTQKGTFKPDYRARLDPSMKFISYAVTDINFDGLVDIILLTSSPTGQLYLQPHYNTATKDKYKICITTIAEELPDYFPYHFINNYDQLDNQGLLKIQRVKLESYPQQWTQQKLSNQYFYLRTGDINNDGFTDLIVDGPNKAILLINQQCLNQFCGSYNPKFMETWPLGHIRIFSVRNIDGLNNYNGKICKMSFFDFLEDGRLDIFASLCPVDSFSEEKPGKLLTVYNSLAIDAFFIKITILENLNFQPMSPSIINRKFNIYGSHSDFYVTALTGERVPACGNQLSHPGRSLQLPYIHTGIGRTNNYIQQLSATVSTEGQIEVKSWSPIVPNSQLIIVPGPKWILQTYISPTAVLSVLFWFVVLILILIGLWICKLTRQQKAQDKQNQDSFYSILR